MKKVENSSIEVMDWMKITGCVIIVIFAAVGIAFVLATSFSHYNFNTSFTGDYVDTLNKHLDSKISTFKDSSMSNVNKPLVYNRYVDSANKYVYIQQYLNAQK